ncbi:MAG: Rqc2 family fibronectin-binding protein [Desulfocucumaceae bacterium]
MPFDGMVLSAITRELNQDLTGCRIDKVHQPLKEEVHLVLSRTGAKFRLLLSADPGTARVHITGKSPENPPSPPVFCMVLRKHLEGGRIAGFSQLGYDRVLIITIDARDELGRTSQKQLICEIMGKHSNVILLDPDSGNILDGIKRYSHAVSRHREVLPGREYVPAPTQEKTNPLSMADEDFFKLMLEKDLDAKIRDLVQKNFDGLSPLMAREIVWRAGLDPDITLNTCGEFDLTSVYRVLKDIYSSAEKGEFNPAVIYTAGQVKDFAAFDLTHLDSCTRVSGKMNEVVDIYFTHKSLGDRIGRMRQSVTSLITKETGRLGKKLTGQRADLEAASEADSLKLAGELVTGNIHTLKKGDTEVYLENFYLEGSPREKVTLDPHLTPAENAQSFFRRYNKFKKTAIAATQHIQKTAEELDYLAGVENSAHLASSPEELDQIREELIEQGYLKPSKGKPSKGKPSKKKEKEFPRPATYLSSGGFTILAGKNNRQNDYLTMKLARQEDIWLHTKDIPGSHVIIKTEGKAVPPETLEEAARLAALFSRARQSGKVPVDYTLRKYVSKPKGAKPGYVIYTDQKTIIAEPDESLPERMTTK